jgi:hypothetical protein
MSYSSMRDRSRKHPRNYNELAKFIVDGTTGKNPAAVALGQRTVKGIAEEFLAFMRIEYDEHYKDSPLPLSLRDGPEFLIGGFGQNDKFPCSYRMRVKENDIREEFANGTGGLSWNGAGLAIVIVDRGGPRTVAPTIEHEPARKPDTDRARDNPRSKARGRGPIHTWPRLPALRWRRACP